MQQINTIVGALIAALIFFVGAIVTLFANDPDLTFDTISQAAWVAAGGGAALQFLKDFQAVTVRRLAGKVTGSK